MNCMNFVTETLINMMPFYAAEVEYRPQPRKKIIS